MSVSRKLTNEQISAIRTLAKSGATQKDISRRLGVSRWAANNYGKGINPPRRITEETERQVVMLLEHTDASYVSVANIVGINPKTVSRIAKRHELRNYKQDAVQCHQGMRRKIPPRPQNQRYSVLLYNIAGQEGKEVYKEFDRVPLYWDLKHLCEDNGIQSEDFQNDQNTDYADKLVFGTVFRTGTDDCAAKFTIERLQGTTQDYMIYDGLDKDIWSDRHETRKTTDSSAMQQTD